MNAPGQLALTEYEPRRLDPDALPDTLGKAIWEVYQGKIEVDFPSPKTDGKWELTSLGWVGVAPVTPELVIDLRPRVPIANVFGMLEHAWNLKGFGFMPGEVEVSSIEAFFDRLAMLFTRRVMDRTRRGLHREYVERIDRLPYLRGRLDVARAARSPWSPVLTCRFEERTADVFHNQVLAWTLRGVVGSPAATDRSRPSSRRAFHELEGTVSLLPIRASELASVKYTRLNEDYRILHGLARFFLEHAGPTHERGGHRMVPFLIHMPRLFERFVVEWLKANLPAQVGYRVAAQEKYLVRPRDDLHFRIDIVVRDRMGRSVMVLDTKYKVDRPSADDVAQIVAYASAEGCREGVLVYPSSEIARIDERVGDIRVRTLPFSLDGDLDGAGARFLGDLMG